MEDDQSDSSADPDMPPLVYDADLPPLNRGISVDPDILGSAGWYSPIDQIWNVYPHERHLEHRAHLRNAMMRDMHLDLRAHLRNGMMRAMHWRMNAEDPRLSLWTRRDINDDYDTVINDNRAIVTILTRMLNTASEEADSEDSSDDEDDEDAEGEHDWEVSTTHPDDNASEVECVSTDLDCDSVIVECGSDIEI
jgi:hypothetical protein